MVFTDSEPIFYSLYVPLALPTFRIWPAHIPHTNYSFIFLNKAFFLDSAAFLSVLFLLYHQSPI